MIGLINKIASYILFIKMQRLFESNGWFVTILYMTLIEFLILLPGVFYIAVYVSQFVGLAIVPISVFSSFVMLYILNKKVYGKYNKAIVHELALMYDKSNLNKIRLLVFGIFLAAAGFFIGIMNWMV